MRDSTAGVTRPFAFLGWAIAAYVAVLWGEQLLYEERLPVHPSDVVAVAVAIIAAPRAWRRLGDPIVLVTIALGASLLISTLAAGDRIGINVAGRLGVQAMLVAVLAHVFGGGAVGDRRVVERAVVAIALASAAVTVIGGVLGASGLLDPLQPLLERPAFVDRIGNPTFGRLPRFTGGFSYSAENAGLWAAGATAVVLAWRPRWAVLPVVAALGTLSVGGAAVIAAGAARWRWVAAAAVVVTLAIQWPVHRGPAVTGELAPAVCDRFPNHWAQWRLGDACALRGTTRYAVAKAHAAELIRAHPLLGAGAAGFARHAWHEVRSDGALYWNPYVSPHGAWHGIAAEQGLLGISLLLTLVALVVRALARAPRDPTWLATTGILLVLLAASLDLDVHRQRLLWLALGAAAGLVRPAPSRRRT